MLHGIVTLMYFIYTIVSGRFVHLPSILLLFQIPYILTLVLLCICTSISLFAAMLIGRRDLRTSIWDGGVGVPGLNEDFYAWLFKWGIIALTSVQEATFLNENEALRMPRTTIVENMDDRDLEEENAIRSGIGFRREWIRTGTVSKNRIGGLPSRRENLRSAFFFVRATFRTYTALLLRYLHGEEPSAPRIRATTPYLTRGVTPYDEDNDEDYIFSDRDTNPSSDDEDDADVSTTASSRRGRSRGNTPIPAPFRTPGSLFLREDSPFDTEFLARRQREYSPFLRETVIPSTSPRSQRETTPFDILEIDPPSTYNAKPPSISDHEDNYFPPPNPLSELFPDLASTISSLLNPSSQTESEDSQLLMSHLSSQQILTRSRYRDETEAQRLEKLIRTRRVRQRLSNDTEENHDVAEVQKCAVCRTNPRVIVIWPCRFSDVYDADGRCLALCDDCRQTLAVRNFSGCPCCRRKVASYSRIYIP
jgi:hypothetical protein